MQVVVVAALVMAKDIVEDAMVCPFLHVSIKRGVVTTEVIVGRNFANLTRLLPILLH